MRTLSLLFCFFYFAQMGSAQQAAIIPLKLQYNYIFIELRVNNSEPLHFMFDTGAGVTVIDTATARRLNLEVSGVARIKTSGGVIEAATSKNNQIRINDFIVNQVNLEIMPLGHLATYLNHPLDGIIGYDFLKRFVVEINIDQAKFMLYRCKTQRLQLRKGESVKMYKLPYGLFGIRALLQADKNGPVIDLMLKIDSGYEDALSLSGQTVTLYDLLRGRRTGVAESMSADPTITRNRTAKLHQLSFAGTTWKKVPTLLTIDPLNTAATQQDLANGFIGQALLLDFNIIYDLPNERIVFQRRR